MPETDLVDEVRALLGEGQPSAEALASALELLLARLDCQLATLHRLEPGSELLTLVAERNLPEFLRPIVSKIPVGKGMAGLAAERRAPVQICNLQSDDSGDARPGAKATGMEGSICLPVIVDGELLGTFGVAKDVPYDFNGGETEVLERLSACFAPLLRSWPL